MSGHFSVLSLSVSVVQRPLQEATLWRNRSHHHEPAGSECSVFVLYTFIQVYIIVWNLSLGPPGGRVVIALDLQLFAPYNVSGYFCIVGFP